MGTANFTTQSYPSVSNLSATSDGFGILISSTSSAATGFRTGDNSGGYTLRSVTAKFRSADALTRDTLTVAIHAVSSGNPAASATHTLSQNDPTGAGEFTFTCSGDCSLSKDTPYFLVLSGDSTGSRGFTWDTTASIDQTNTPDNFGWAIDDAAKWYYSNAWHAQSGWMGIFEVSATLNPSLDRLQRRRDDGDADYRPSRRRRLVLQAHEHGRNLRRSRGGGHVHEGPHRPHRGHVLHLQRVQRQQLHDGQSAGDGGGSSRRWPRRSPPPALARRRRGSPSPTTPANGGTRPTAGRTPLARAPSPPEPPTRI